MVSLARELNRLGVASGVLRGFAINCLGFVRATEAIDLRIARDLANQTRIKRALEILPDRALRELGDEDIARWVIDRGGLAAPFNREPSAVNLPLNLWLAGRHGNARERGFEPAL